MSLNAPAGACAMTLGLKGPSTTASIGEGSGLLSIALAARWLADRDDADALLAAAIDERDPEADGPGVTEGVVCALLEASADASADANPRGAGVVVAGVGLAGPLDLAGAVARALDGHPELDGVLSDADADGVRRELSSAGRDVARLPLGVVDAGAPWGRGEACRSAYAFAAAVERLRAGEARSLLVVTGVSRSSSVAVLLRRVEGVRA
jgi:hypothetical protein